MLLPYLICSGITLVVMLIAVATARWWMPLVGRVYRETQESMAIGINRFIQTQETEEKESED